jgi:hypothetical protein
MKSPFATPEAATATKIAQLQGESEPSDTVAAAYGQKEIQGIQRMFVAHGSFRETKASLA